MKYRACAAIVAMCLMAVGLANARTPKKVATAGSSADGPAFLGTYKDWSAYTRGSGDAKVCYALSEPKTKEPDNVKRDPAYFLINDWPERHSRAETEIVPGYRYQEGSTAAVQIGNDKFVFFTKNDVDSGSAWVLNPADEAKLLKTMRAGAIATVTGTSRRGTKTTDTYGLSGVSDAIDRIHDACRM